jgi:hypothetical protein
MIRRIVGVATAAIVIFTGAVAVAGPAQADTFVPIAAAVDNAPRGTDGLIKFPPPPIGGKASSFADDAIQPGDTYRYWGDTYQFVPTGTLGVNAGFTIRNIYKAPQEYHSLMEISTRSADGKQQVEIGWGKGLWCGQLTTPCLFGYHWKDGVATCYPDGTTGSCGWTDYGSSLDLKDTLADSPAGCSFRMGIRENATTRDMMLWATPCYGTQPVQWIGHFARSNWAATADPNWTIGLTQVFGEVASKYDPVVNPQLDGYPCTDMGNGNLATNTNGPYPASGSRIGDIEFAGLPKSVVNMTPDPASDPAFEPDMPGAYDVKAIEGIADSGPGNRRYFNVGGPGFAAANGPTKPGTVGGC